MIDGSRTLRALPIAAADLAAGALLARHVSLAAGLLLIGIGALVLCTVAYRTVRRGDATEFGDRQPARRDAETGPPDGRASGRPVDVSARDEPAARRDAIRGNSPKPSPPESTTAERRTTSVRRPSALRTDPAVLDSRTSGSPRASPSTRPIPSRDVPEVE